MEFKIYKADPMQLSKTFDFEMKGGRCNVPIFGHYNFTE
jgi:hypothetical protein